jgi:galactonate dehydratase
LSGKLSAEAEHLGTERIATIRQAVGPDIEILIDCHGRFDVSTAIRLGKALEPYDIFWFEEPVPVESHHALRQVWDKVSVPICVGERLHTRWEFVPILENEESLSYQHSPGNPHNRSTTASIGCCLCTILVADSSIPMG